MVARKQRIPLVLDTNVFIRAFKSRSRRTANQRLVRLWLLEKRTQLIVCDELIDEYLGVFEKLLGMDDELIGGNKGEETKGTQLVSGDGNRKELRPAFSPPFFSEKSCVPLFLS